MRVLTKILISVMIIVVLSCDKSEATVEIENIIKDNIHNIQSFELTSSVEPAFHFRYFIKIHYFDNKAYLWITSISFFESSTGNINDLVIRIPGDEFKKFLVELSDIDMNELLVHEKAVIDGIRGFTQIIINNTDIKEFIWTDDSDAERDFLKKLFAFVRQYVFHNPHLLLIENTMSYFQQFPGYYIDIREIPYVNIFCNDDLEELKSELESFEKDELIVFNFSNLRIWRFQEQDYDVLRNVLSNFNNAYFLLEDSFINFTETEYSLYSTYEYYGTDTRKNILIELGVAEDKIYSKISHLKQKLEYEKWVPSQRPLLGTPVPVPDLDEELYEFTEE